MARSRKYDRARQKEVNDSRTLEVEENENVKSKMIQQKPIDE